MSDFDAEDRAERPPRRASRFQISENTLFNAGFDRPTVEALRHLLNAVGNTSDVITLPQAATELESLAFEPIPVMFVPSTDDLTPAVQPLDLSTDDLTPAIQLIEQVEFLQTEVRQLAEAVAALTSRIYDLEQGITP